MKKNRSVNNSQLNTVYCERLHERRFIRLVALITMLCAVFVLITPALAAEISEHSGHKEHTDACYTRVLVCPIPEQGHTHTDTCYEEHLILTCGLDETAGHIHTDTCYSDLRVLICENTDPSHVHNGECYNVERILSCNIAECAPHVHSDSCYSPEMVPACGIEECEFHKHSDNCYVSELTCELSLMPDVAKEVPSPGADRENESLWVQSFEDVVLTGNWAEDVLMIALSQLGYKESTRDFKYNEITGEKMGYTRYGDWYGFSHGDWCAMFISFCLHYAGADEVMPISASCQEWIKALKQEEYDLYRESGTYSPKPGDLIFYDWDGFEDEELRRADHVGIVVELKDNGLITTIEGNLFDQVQYSAHNINDAVIMGYGLIPESPSVNTADDTSGKDFDMRDPINYSADVQSPSEPDNYSKIDIDVCSCWNTVLSDNDSPEITARLWVWNGVESAVAVTESGTEDSPQRTVSLNKENGWMSSFTDLPALDEPLCYVITEDLPDNCSALCSSGEKIWLNGKRVSAAVAADAKRLRANHVVSFNNIASVELPAPDNCGAVYEFTGDSAVSVVCAVGALLVISCSVILITENRMRRKYPHPDDADSDF